MNILLLNGPNLNLLGSREQRIYGSDTLLTIVTRLSALAEAGGATFDHYQSNSESDLITRVHEKGRIADVIILNPAAFTHTSIALRDAILSVATPLIEIHISNIYKRESFRQTSYFSDIASGVIIGLGTQVYDLALKAALSIGKKE